MAELEASLTYGEWVEWIAIVTVVEPAEREEQRARDRMNNPRRSR